MGNWVENFLTLLYKLGYFGNLTEKEAIDGVGGKNTTNAYKLAKKDGYRWNSDTQQLYRNEEVSNEETTKETNDEKSNNKKINNDELQIIYFRPSITSTLTDNLQCSSGECAFFVNEELGNFFGNRPYGDAWQNLIHSNSDSRFSGFLNAKNKTGQKRNIEAADNLRISLDTLNLDKRVPYITNFYYADSPNVEKANKEAYNISGIGRTTGTHSGLTWWDDKSNTWMTTDNVGWIRTRPFKYYLYESDKMRPTAMGAFGSPLYIPTFSFEDVDSVDRESTIPDKTVINDTPKYSYELDYDFDKIYNHATNGKLMFQEYPNGVEDLELLNKLHIYPNGGLDRYGNILSPLNIQSLEYAALQGDKIQNAYNLPTHIYLSFFPLTLGILWKENNGGSNLYASSSGLKENTTYNDNHLGRFRYFLRKTKDILPFLNEMSSTSGSVKLGNVPLTFGNKWVKSFFPVFNENLNKTRIVADNMYGASNVISNLANNYVNLIEMLGNKANILFNKDGSLNDLANVLLLEAHNQGLNSGIKLSIDKYLSTDNLDYLLLYMSKPIGNKLHSDSDEIPNYGNSILTTLKRGFDNISVSPTMLDEIVIEK